MKPIQVILILMISGIAYIVITHFPSRKLFQLTVGSLVGLGLFFTLFFDYSTYLANLLGIGRGVDLILYLGLTGMMLICLLLYKRILSLEEKLTHLVREESLGDPKDPIMP